MRETPRWTPTSFTSTFRCSGARSAWALSISLKSAIPRAARVFDRARGNGVHADFLFAQIVGKITNAAFERRFGHAHHVVSGNDSFQRRSRSMVMMLPPSSMSERRRARRR